METKYNFTLMSIAEFETWLAELRVARTIITVQQHHTYSPDYKLFKGSNHFELQKAMRDYHVTHNGWENIGQHFTIFPDGTVMTGRPLERSPACIAGNNANSLCIEAVGNFDKNGDSMNDVQKECIVRVVAAICKRFGIPVGTDKILYHHWFNLTSGARNNGSGGNKSCPGSNFFGGNKVADCEKNFIPLIQNALAGTTVSLPEVLKYVCVTSDTLNVRQGPVYTANLADDREAATFGAILRIYKEENGWYRISSSQEHWVSGRYTKDVIRATVNANTLNVRNQPGIQGLKIGSFKKNQEIFVFEDQDGWSKVSMEEKWVKTSYLTIV